jgi:phage tail-like protein
MSDSGDAGGTGGTWHDSDSSADPGGTGGSWRDSESAREAGSQSAWQDSSSSRYAGSQSAWRESSSLRSGGQQSAWRKSTSIDENSPWQLPGISLFYKVTLEVVDLGFWTKASGLGMTIATDHRGDSAMSFFQHHLPGHMQYDTLTLERPVSADTATVMNWISAYHMLPIPTTGEVACVDQTSQKIVMTWEMFGISPMSWKGPSLDANTTNVATEVLTLAHMGFM